MLAKNYRMENGCMNPNFLTMEVETSNGRRIANPHETILQLDLNIPIAKTIVGLCGFPLHNSSDNAYK